MPEQNEGVKRWAMDSRRVGIVPDADGTGEVGLGVEEAGRKIALRFTLDLRDRRISRIRYQVFGCGYSMAACAAVAELATDCPLQKAEEISAEQVVALLGGFPEERRYCVDLALEALRAAVASARGGDGGVRSVVHVPPGEYGPRVTAEDPLYVALTAEPLADQNARQDRHVFACLVAAAAQDGGCLPAALGLEEQEFADLWQHFFPQVASPSCAEQESAAGNASGPRNQDVRELVLSYVPTQGDGLPEPKALWLAKILAARAALPGHLWVAMGFFERPQLSAAIERYLPGMFAANHQKMRWKRFLFKQICDMNGGLMCKSPNCGECSDYTLCFGED